MTVRTATLLLPFLLIAACGPKPKEAPKPEPVTWNLHIRPILAAKCFRCHGPLELHNESGLRLDREESALALLPESDRHALVPGDPAESLLWTRIHSEDPDAQMPPPDSGLALSDEEKELITKWIEQGAKYEPHWAFTPLRAEIPVPAADASWARNEIDRFAHARLKQSGSRPQAPADPSRWLRRVSLDLTGLPPTAADREAFLAALEDSAGDAAAGAAAVDRLLASPAFGEEMATTWLTTLGYGDHWTHAEEPLNSQWPYRDWVVNAFNQNLPYHQFITQQLAGDLLDDATTPEVLATAFLRSVPLSDAPETPPAERLAAVAAARVSLLGRSVLGLTVDCARCHHHPVDPLTRRDIHGLMAYFHSINESGRPGSADIVPAPTLFLPDPEQEAALEACREKLRTIEERLAAVLAGREPAFREWLALEEKLPVIADATGIFTFDDKTAAIPNRALGAAASGTAGGMQFAEGVHGPALQLDGIGAAVFLDVADVERWDAWTIAMWLLDNSGSPEASTIVSRAEAGRGIDLELAGGHLTARLARDWPGNAIALRSSRPVVRKGEWTHVTWTYDGSSRAAGLHLFENGKPIETTVVADTLSKSAVPKAGIPLRLGPGPADGAVDDFHVFARALTPLEVAHLHDGRALTAATATGDEQVDALRAYYMSSLDPETRGLRDELAAARRKLVEAENTLLEVAVMREGPDPRPVTLTPGSGEPIPPALPSVLPSPPEAPTSRLDLGAALTTTDHPLTARVFVNRLWAHFFGTGIVATTHDLGMMSPAPADPELLDWLARDFIDSGWDVKALCRKIVLSAAFRQEPVANPKDAHAFTVLARPLPRAALRDLALTASGLLDPAVGGPPVPPDASGEGSHRRSLYSAWHRPGPRLAPVAGDDSGDHHCIVTATGAVPELLLLRHTDRHLLEAARAIARQLLQNESADDEEQLRQAFMLLAARPPGPEELVTLNLALLEERSRFTAGPDDAPQLISPRQSEDPVDPQELAAWITIVEALFAHDAVTIRP